jgi:pyruvate dehydrogenase E2 component (dihydrolipoamide acetyltransferase)
MAMEEVMVGTWLVADGADVVRGQPLVEVETDKATEELESPGDGRLRIVAPEGSLVRVEGLLAEILTADDGRAAIEPGVTPPPMERSVATPAARRLAREHGIDAAAVIGTGPEGRITVSDVEAAFATKLQSPSRQDATPSLRAAVIEGITRNWRDIPHIQIAAELLAEGLHRARETAATTVAERVTITDVLILAVARALIDVPELNGTRLDDGSIKASSVVNLALAVAGESGVVAPVLRDVSAMRFRDVVLERARLVAAARSGTLTKHELGGATCTLSNLGSHLVDYFAPIITGPQVALVATGRIAERAVVIGGRVEAARTMWTTVAIDHRAADGEAGGRFLATLQRHMNELAGDLQKDMQKPRTTT